MKEAALIAFVVVFALVSFCCNANTAGKTAESAPLTNNMEGQAPKYKLLYVYTGPDKTRNRFVKDPETIEAVQKWVESVWKNCPPAPKREVELPYEPETQISFFKNPKAAEDMIAFQKEYRKLRDDYLYIYEGTLETHNRKIEITDALALYEILGMEFPATEKDRKILAVKSHRLDWKNYAGTGDPLKAEYYLDGIRLGIGEKGVAELKRLIAKMPSGSDVDVLPYYEGRRPYPFDKSELQKYCDKHGVSLGIPIAK